VAQPITRAFLKDLLAVVELPDPLARELPRLARARLRR
jgi:hypothetical protein